MSQTNLTHGLKVVYMARASTIVEDMGYNNEKVKNERDGQIFAIIMHILSLGKAHAMCLLHWGVKCRLHF